MAGQESLTLAGDNYANTVSDVQISIQLEHSKPGEWTVKLTATPSSQSTPANIGLRVGNDVGGPTG